MMQDCARYRRDAIFERGWGEKLYARNIVIHTLLKFYRFSKTHVYPTQQYCTGFDKCGAALPLRALRPYLCIHKYYNKNINKKHKY